MSSNAIRTEATSHLHTLSKEKGLFIDGKLHTIKKEIIGLQNSVSTLLNQDQYSNLTDEEVRKKLRTSIAEVTKKYSESIDGNASTYVVFKPDFVNVDLQVPLIKQNDKYVDRQQILTYADLSNHSDELLWFFETIETEEEYWSEPYEDKYLDAKLVTYTYPITYRGQVVGVVGTDILFDDFEKMIKDVKIYDTGYAFLLCDEYEFLVHPTYTGDDDIELVANGAFKEVKQYMMENSGGIKFYKVNGKKKVVGFHKLSNGWILGVCPPLKEIYSQLDVITYYILIISIIGFFVAVFISILIGKKISKPIMVAVKFAKKMSTGDLTENIPMKYINRKDEIGTLSNALQTLIDEFGQIIKSIINSSENVSTASEELYSMSMNVSQISNEVALSTEEIAKGTTEQAQNTEVGAQKVYNIGDSIENNKELVNNINQRTEDVVGLIDEGLKIIEDLTDKTHETKNSSQDISVIVNETNEKVGNIGEASSLITSISEQTNLLALNAAIEAARAGEAGKGFAVVADEIRKLAEQSTQSSEKIDNMVKELTDSSILAVDTINRVLDIVKAQVNSVQKTEEKYKEISSAIDITKDAITKLNESEIQMNHNKDEVMDMIQGLSAISEQNAAGTQEVSASIEEQAASLKNMETSTQQLSKLAEELLTLISKFKVK
jgi:methyl-accepting chemotaxis protein